MKIGALARMTGHTVDTIRYYESRGLLEADARTASGYRVFSPEAVHRLEFIKQARHLGLSLDQAREILLTTSQERPVCEQVRSLLQARLTEVDTRLRELEEFRGLLVALLQRPESPADSGRVCSIIESAPARA